MKGYNILKEDYEYPGSLLCISEVDGDIQFLLGEAERRQVEVHAVLLPLTVLVGVLQL
jgi:hypothetical protein